MSSFTEAIVVDTGQRISARRVYRLVTPMRYDIGYLGSGLSIVVPAGFLTDGPSVPWWIAWALPVRTMLRSAIVHDRLREDLRFGKIEGDAIFLAAMYAERTPAWLRWPAFVAVLLNNSRQRATGS